MSGSAGVKALNAVLACAMLVLFGLHGLGNALQLIGVGSIVPSVLSWALFAIACAHGALGIVMTLQTLEEQRRAGAAYWSLNARFWVVRISGLAIALLVICHLIAFGQFGDGPFRLSYFGPVQLALSLLLVISLAVHVLANVQPLMIALGIAHPRGRAIDLGVAVSAACLIAGIAFIVYFIRWSVI